MFGCNFRMGFDIFWLKSLEAGPIFQSKVAIAAINVIWSVDEKNKTKTNN